MVENTRFLNNQIQTELSDLMKKPFLQLFQEEREDWCKLEKQILSGGAISLSKAVKEVILNEERLTEFLFWFLRPYFFSSEETYPIQVFFLTE